MIKQSLLLEAVKLNPSAIVDLFRLNLASVGGPVICFHDGTFIGNSDVMFQGTEYAAWPVQAQGFEWTTTGAQPRPTISFSNVLGTFTQLNQQYGGLVGCRFVRLRTFARFLDGMPYADPSAAFPLEAWVINRKTDENRVTCTYELANPMDFEDLVLPRRRILADQCSWRYRGNGCGYNGNQMFDANDKPLPYYNIISVPVAGAGASSTGAVMTFGQAQQVILLSQGYNQALATGNASAAAAFQNALNQWKAATGYSDASWDTFLRVAAETFGALGAPVAETLTTFVTMQARPIRGVWNNYTGYYYGDAVEVVTTVGPQFFVCLYPNGPGYGAPQQPPVIGSSNYWALDDCSLRLSGCKLRFGNGSLPFGGFPGTRETPIDASTI